MSQIDKIDINRLLSEVEFFAYEHEVWYRLPDGTTNKLRESDSELTSAICELLEEFYPKAFSSLCDEYKNCKLNISYFRFRIVSRFVKCNFASLDNVPDMTNGLFSNFEYVSCPLRGECRHECVICRPEFNHKLSGAEMRVMSLWYSGSSEDTIASRLCLSPHTIHNHIRNSYFKLGVHSRAAFVKFADDNGLFK